MNLALRNVGIGVGAIIPVYLARLEVDRSGACGMVLGLLLVATVINIVAPKVPSGRIDGCILAVGVIGLIPVFPLLLGFVLVTLCWKEPGTFVSMTFGPTLFTTLTFGMTYFLISIGLAFAIDAMTGRFLSK